ncbi:MAG: hypothetical protein J7K40_03975 [candidate division Zixibacteria bacterium]|nr:hypothetical protein [candidate division Zixibacteria bacterium]
MTRDADKQTLNELQGDIADMKAFMDCIDAHIHWLGATLPIESVEIPEFKAAVATLERMERKTGAIKRGL